jgi:hypothetical protein
VRSAPGSMVSTATCSGVSGSGCGHGGEEPRRRRDSVSGGERRYDTGATAKTEGKDRGAHGDGVELLSGLGVALGTTNLSAAIFGRPW